MIAGTFLSFKINAILFIDSNYIPKYENMTMWGVYMMPIVGFWLIVFTSSHLQGSVANPCLCPYRTAFGQRTFPPDTCDQLFTVIITGTASPVTVTCSRHMNGLEKFFYARIYRMDCNSSMRKEKCLPHNTHQESRSTILWDCRLIQKEHISMVSCYKVQEWVKQI